MPECFFCGFTGSLGYADTEQAFSALGHTIGCRACRIPDGETGKRHKWITWQREVFEKSSQFGVSFSYTNRDGTCFDLFKPLVPPEDLKLDLGYADFACESFSAFVKFRDQGRIPSGVRFQVSLPTPTALLTVFVDREYRLAVAPALQNAMAREVQQITTKIPECDLALQWDVAVEVIGFEGGGAPPRYPLHIAPKELILKKTAEEIAALSNSIPEAVEVGVHFCYGSANAKNSYLRAVQPQDLGVSVCFANEVLQLCERRVDFVHLLSPQERFDDAWFAPLGDLAEGPEVLLGVIHLSDGVPGVVARVCAARRHLGRGRRLGIAAECGLGGLMEYGPQEMDTMLETHAAAVDCLNVIMGNLQSIPADSRLRQCLERAVQVMHEAIEELKPSKEEWQNFLEFLNRTAECCTETRNEFIMVLDFLGVRPLLDEIEAASWPEDATPPSALGPFRDRDVPRYPAHGGDLCVRKAPPGFECTYLFTAASCGDQRPLAAAEFEVWMADHDGIYSVRDPNAPKHNLYGIFLADDDGKISFSALKPKNYGVNTTGTGGTMLRAWGKSVIRPGHVHVAVKAPGFEPLVTSLYFDDDPYLWADPAWGVSRPLVIKAKESKEGKLMATYTFMLRPSMIEQSPRAKCLKVQDKNAANGRRLTNEVLQSMETCEDPRTKQVFQVLVKKLHSLCEELRPSIDDYSTILRVLWACRASWKSEFGSFLKSYGVSPPDS